MQTVRDNLDFKFGFVCVFILSLLPAILCSLSVYSYDYHNVLLDHFASKRFQIKLPCKALLSDSKRSGRVVLNLFCERQPFQVNIFVPDVSSECTHIQSDEELRLYLNVRSLFLQQSEVINIIDPLSHTKKQISPQHKPNTIDFGLQSYAQALSSGSSILVEYLPGNSVPACSGKDGDSMLMDLDFVIVSKAVPQNIDSYKFTHCPALNGYIPTGILCDQFTSNRQMGCPVNISQVAKPDPATGQDRRNLDCYKLTLGNAAENVKSVMDGTLVVVESVGEGSRAGSSLTMCAVLWLAALLISFIVW